MDIACERAPGVNYITKPEALETAFPSAKGEFSAQFAFCPSSIVQNFWNVLQEFIPHSEPNASTVVSLCEIVGLRID
jgi:hypothetical protein